MMKCSKKLVIRLILVALFFIAALGAEVFYRHPLFDWSVGVQKKLFKTTPKKYLIFFKIFTFLGTQNCLIPFGLIIFFIFPLNITYIIFACVSYAAYITGVLKGVYGEKRPFWEDFSIIRSCDAGYGNPSGHCITAFSIYISLGHLICRKTFSKNNALNIIIKILIFSAFILLNITIGVSRFYMSSHSANQIILGATMGIGLYLYFFHGNKVYLYSGKEFAEYLSDKKFLIFHIIKYVCMLTFLILFPKYKVNEVNKYRKKLDRACPGMKFYRKFNDESVYSGLCIFFLIGTHFGMSALFVYMGKQFREKYDEINHWNKAKLRKLPLKLLLLIPCMVFLVFFFIIDSQNLYIMVAFQVGVPIMLTGFSLTFIYIVVCAKFNLANEKLKKDYMQPLPENYGGEVEIQCNIPDNKSPRVNDLELDKNSDAQSDATGYQKAEVKDAPPRVKSEVEGNN